MRHSHQTGKVGQLAQANAEIEELKSMIAKLKAELTKALKASIRRDK